MKGRKDDEGIVFRKDKPPAYSDHLAVTRILLSVHGIWPLERSITSYVKNVVVVLSMSLHLYCCCLYLIAGWGQYDKMRRVILNMRACIMAMPVQFLIRFHPKLRKLINITTECYCETSFQSKAEKEVYDVEMRKGVILQRIVMIFIFALLGLVLLRPILQLPAAFRDPGNATRHISPMFPVLFNYRDNGYLYFSFYVTQFIVWYIFLCRPISNSFIMLLLMHVTGQCAVLAHRFKNLGRQSENVIKDFERIVEHHIDVKAFTKCLVDVFGLLILLEVFTSIAGMALTLHRVITSGDAISGALNQIFFFVYFGIMLVQIYGFNYCAQNVLNACSDYRETMYMSEWYAMPMKSKTSILLCMLNAEKPIQFSVGGFYDFSYAAFTIVMRNCLGYVSALSAMV